MDKPVDDIVIRRVDLGDAASFDHIAADVFDEAIDPARLTAYLAQPGHLMLLAFDGDLVVGMTMAVVHLHPDKPAELYIDEIGTAPGWTRRGIATAMLREMLDWGREQGCEECWVGTEHGNHAANALYRKWQAAPESFLLYEFDL